MQITKEYIIARTRFLHRLVKHQAASVLAEKANVIEVSAEHEAGRKYDRVFVKVVTQGEKRPNTRRTLLYFIDRTTQRIYGVKSPVAPNETRYFGRLENAKKWDWRGPGAVNKRDDSVAKVGFYGGFDHYVDVTPSAPAVTAEAVAAPEAEAVTA